jgi:AbrB family looped-hinge helix DNA binding protein
MSDPIRAAIDSAGRLVIPKAVREAAGLRPDVPLDIRFRDGRVEIEPAPVVVQVEMRRGVAVAVPEQPVPTHTAAEVERVRRAIREGREGGAE